MVEHTSTPEPTGSSGPRTKARKLSARSAAWLAWSMWALCLPFAVFSGGVLGFLSASARIYPDSGMIVLFALLALTFTTVGAFVASRRPENSIGWIFCAGGLTLSVAVSATNYAEYALHATSTGSLPGVQYAAWIATWAPIPTLLLVATLLFLLFPDGKLPSREWGFVAWTAVIASVMVALGEALGRGASGTDYGSIGNPVAVGGTVGNVLDALGGFGTVLLILSFLASVAAPFIRLGQARGQERQQIKWFAYAAAVTVGGFLVVLLGAGSSELMWDLGWLMGILGFAFLPIATAIAILKYRLYDIDRIINRTLVYGLLTASVVGLYVLVVGGVGTLSKGSDNLLVSLLATGLVALAFHPLRVRLQRGVNRLMYGERDEPYAVLSRLGRRLEGTLAPEEALSTIVETVTQALKLPYAAITLRQDGKFVTAAEHGSPEGEPVILPLVYHTEEVGRLMVAPRTPGEAFASADKQLLDDLAHQAGAAAHAARLTADLRRSRERLVTAREEERRRLRRDLHDGLGPTLGALTIGLDTARSMVTGKPAAEELLARLKEESQEAVTDIRRLVYGLRPPALDDLGLVAAIRQQAAIHGRVATGDPPQLEGANRKGGMVFTVEAADDLPPLPAAVEVATYRIAQEAITNAARHAEAHSCRVCLSLDESARALELRIVDDGVGIPEDHRAGVGMSSMRERAEELGGALTVERLQEGGTCVLAHLPLPAEEE